MCLLIFAWQVEPSYPLVVAANRDEQLDRPASSLCVLREQHPRVLGGRDGLAGGTWLAVNEHGVAAGLTNRPSAEGRDPTKRSRGELPRVLVGRRSAAAGAADLVRQVRPNEYNPAWLLVGDRQSLLYVEVAAGEPLTVRRLSPGIHVLENVPLGQASPKVDRVRAMMSTALSAGEPLWSVLPSVLADHAVPVSASATASDRSGRGPIPRAPATLASCVHTESYGTRSATLVRVPASPEDRPDVLVADGPPCTAPFVDVTARWAG